MQNDLISRSALKKDLLNRSFFPSIVKAALEKAPAVDAVEVVRCKNCKQWSRFVGVVDSPNGYCFYHSTEMNCFDFCSYGERRADDG